MDIMPIEKDRIPYKFDIKIKGQVWTFTVKYNAENDFFTVDLEKDNQVVVAGEKLIFARPLFDDYRQTEAPRNIIPIDPSEKTDRVGWDELSETVFLYIFGGA